MITKKGYPILKERASWYFGIIQKFTKLKPKCSFLIVLFLLRKKHKDVLKIFLFLISLLFLFTFALFHFKYFSNGEYFYNFQQFRYQYIPNAFIALIALLLSSVWLEIKFSKKIIFSFLLIFIFVSNIFNVVKSIGAETEQFYDLNIMLRNIKKGILDGQINKNNKLFLDDSIVNIFPPMCWNDDMGKRFMNRTYQWIFDKDEIKYFADDINDAKWVISEDDFDIKLICLKNEDDNEKL